jgi:hypothetical protein
MAAAFVLVEPTSSIPPDDRVLVELLYERLRLEISAKRVATRRWLRERALSAFDGHAQIAATIDDAIDGLIDAGDVIEGSHGRVAAAPSFLVDLKDGVLLLAGALPTQTWVRRGGPPPAARGAQRTIGPLDATTRAACEVAAATMGVRLISAERWSGLNSAPHADTAWVDALNARLLSAAQPGTHDDDAPWHGFVPDAAKWAWRRRDHLEDSRLWRRTPRSGYDEYAWSGGVSPSSASWIRLGADEATRTTWALARSREAVRCQVRVHGDGRRVVELLGRLPRAEYRWLMTLGQRAEAPRCFEVPATRLDVVLRTLGDRLGVLAGRVGDGEGTHGGGT